MAAAVKAARQPAPADSPLKAAERAGSEFISASLDYYRDVRDALSEAQFFATFGILFPALHPGGRKRPDPRPRASKGASCRSFAKRSPPSMKAATPKRSRARRACSPGKASRSRSRASS
jgi:hypothetical protein